MRVGVQRLALVIALVGLTPVLALAQGSANRSTISGVVQDSSGGVLPGVTIVVKNVATGVTNQTVSNTTGTFSIPALDPGTYQATVSLTGFKTVSVDKIYLTAGNTASIGIVKLDLGQMSETINVQAHSDIIDTVSTTVSATMNIDQLTQLPLVTKNAMYFVTMLPGVNTPSGTHTQRNSTLMGLPQSTISIVIDGVNVQDQAVKSTDGFYADIRPQTDLVEQVTVSEATANADSSGQGAVQIRFVTRSGTNKQAGSAYEYLRDTSLNSNSYFNVQKGLPRNTANWNQFGFRQGGPIVIPGMYDGRGKAFYFVNHEEFRLPVRNSTVRTALSPASQAGNFFYGCTASGCAGSVNVLALAAANGQLSAIDPTIKSMYSTINAALASEGAVQKNIDLNTLQYSWQPKLFRAEHLPGGRVDVNVTNKNRLTVTSVFQKANSDPDIVNNGFSSYPGVAVDSTQYSFRYTGTASLRTTLSNNLVNDGGWGVITSPVYFSANLTPDRFVGGRTFNFLSVSGNTLTNFNVNNGNSTSRNGSNYNFHDTLTWLKGSHSMSFGGTYTMVSEWDATTPIVPSATLGFDQANDPANFIFTAANFPGAAGADLNNARNLYAMLTGRVTAINANSVLQPNGTYQYRGNSFQRFQQPELGMFAQDSWRVSPRLTVNAGLRYELQYPIRPLDALFARNDLADLCGRAGFAASAPSAASSTLNCPFGLPGVALTAAAPTYKKYDAGAPGYNLDKNNFGPSIGVAWQPNVETGFGRKLLGDPALTTLRASFTRAFNQGGTSDYTGTLTNGPGLTVTTNRNVANNNLVLAGDGATYGGNGWPFLLTQDARFGAPATCAAGQPSGPCVPVSPTYPQSPSLTGTLQAFDPNYQTSYTDSWSVGIQRAVGKDMSVEVRWVANEAHALATTVDYNEINIYNAGFGGSANFKQEFINAQKNLAYNIANGKGATFAYTGAGTSPLPIFLASYSGLAGCVTTVTCSGASDPTKYTSAQFTNNTALTALSQLSPNIGAASVNNSTSFASFNTTNGLVGNTTFLANGRAAGMPVNFWTLNPDVQTDNLRTAQGFTKYHSIQILVNRRLSRGLAVSANYAYAVALQSSLDTLFRDRATIRNTGSAVPHALKMTVNYDVPVGRGKRYGSNMNSWVNGVIGDWQVNLTGRVETGRLFDIGDVKLVNFSLADLQKEFKYYVNPADNMVYMIPQDLIANTVKAFAVDATSATGHPVCTGTNATTCGGPDPTKPYLAPASDANCTRIIAGDCGVRQQLLKAPVFTRFDLSLKKRFPFAHTASFDLGIDLLNVFNAIDFNSVFTTSTTPDNYRVTSAYSDVNQSYDPGGRIGQLIFRVNW
jgi:Carboxypeptidase regulatory-like domain/TonB dependent receptor-like, beta-barrel